MTTTTSDLQLPKLGKKQLAALFDKAKGAGMTPQRYVRQLIEQDLALDQKAKTTTLANLMGPGRDVNEQDLDRMADRARSRYARRRSVRAKK